jgi:hypothetical protein
MALTFPGVNSVSYEYRVFIVHQAKESTFLHLSAERLWDGVVSRLRARGSELDARSVIVYSVLTHPARWKARDRIRPRVASIGSGAGVGRMSSG